MVVKDEICANEAVVEKGSKLSLQAAGTRALPERLIFRPGAPLLGPSVPTPCEASGAARRFFLFPSLFRHPPSEVQLPTIAIDSILSLKVSFH